MLVTDIADVMCWLQLKDGGDDFTVTNLSDGDINFEILVTKKFEI